MNKKQEERALKEIAKASDLLKQAAAKLSGIEAIDVNTLNTLRDAVNQATSAMDLLDLWKDIFTELTSAGKKSRNGN